MPDVGPTGGLVTWWMAEKTDIALVVEPDDILVAHQVACPAAREAAAAGWPVMTMIGCERMIGRDETHRWHRCMEDD